MIPLKVVGVGIEKEGRRILRGIDLSLEPGQVAALVGPNGSGKSTLLRLLCGVWSPTEGRVELNGRNLGDHPIRQIARSIALVRQSVSLRYSFTVREVVAMGRYPHTGRVGGLGAADERVVEESMVKTDVAGLADRHANRLSGGELQRVLLARCLATEAPVILLDEPTSNLDLSHSLEVLHLMRGLARGGKSVVVALHDLNAALRYADQAVVLSEGAAIDSGPVREVLTPEKVERVFGVRAEPVRSETGEDGFFFHRIEPGREG